MLIAMKEKDMKYLVKFKKDINECVFFISPFGYDKFLEIYKESTAWIRIIEFYGSTLDREYGLEDSRSIKTIQDLILYLNDRINRSLVLNNLKIEFATNGSNYSFNDNYECTVTSQNKNQFIQDLTTIFDSITLDINILYEVLREDSNYFLVSNNNGIEKKFISFDDYLQSGFTL